MSAKNETKGNVMTREQKLYAMRMVDLVEVAEKLGVKIDKKGKKSTAVLKILKAEAEQNEKPELKLVSMPGIEKLAELKAEYCGDEASQKAKRKSTAKTSGDRSKKSSKSKDDISVIAVIEKLAKDNGFVIKRKSDIAAQYKFADSPAMFGTVVYKNYVTLYCRSRYVEEKILRQMTHLKSSFDVNIKISSDSLDIAKQIISDCVDYNKLNKKSKKGEK